MLRSELHSLESLVNELVASKVPVESESYDKTPVEVAGLILSECDRLRSKWVNQLFSQTKDQVIFRYVRFHQSGLTRLSDQLSDEAIRSGAAYDCEHLTEALRSLDELLQFFQHSHNGFFETSMTESRYRREREQKVYLQATRELEADLLHILPGSTLAEAITGSLLDQLADFPNEQVSYRQSSVINQFLTALRYYLKGVDPVDEKKLFLFVYKMNLNSKRVVSWFKQAVNKPGFYSAQEMAEMLAALRNSSRQPVDANETTIAAVLVPWIQEGQEKPVERTVSLSALQQMPLNFSVAQFALFVRVCYRAGCFSLSNAAEIIRFFTAHFTTKRQDDVSVKSFTKGFYAMDQTSAAVIRDFLQRMIAFINKTYFP